MQSITVDSFHEDKTTMWQIYQTHELKPKIKTDTGKNTSSIYGSQQCQYFVFLLCVQNSEYMFEKN